MLGGVAHPENLSTSKLFRASIRKQIRQRMKNPFALKTNPSEVYFPQNVHPMKARLSHPTEVIGDQAKVKASFAAKAASTVLGFSSARTKVYRDPYKAGLS